MSTFQGRKTDNNELTLILSDAQYQDLQGMAATKGMTVEQFAKCAIKTALTHRFRKYKGTDAIICQFLRTKERT